MYIHTLHNNIVNTQSTVVHTCTMCIDVHVQVQCKSTDYTHIIIHVQVISSIAGNSMTSYMYVANLVFLLWC